MVIKLKQSIMDEIKVMILKDFIKRVAEMHHTFLFGTELGVPCILHHENRSSEKMVVMILLEGLCYHLTGVDAKVYFKELETRPNNSILAEKISNWVITTKCDELKKISFSNLTARKFINKIGKLFDLVFEYHLDGGARISQFQICADTYPQIMEKIRQRHYFKDGDIVKLQKNIGMWYAT